MGSATARNIFAIEQKLLIFSGSLKVPVDPQCSADLSAWQARCVFKTIVQMRFGFPASTVGIVICFPSAAFADLSIHSFHELHNALNGILHHWGQLGLFDFWTFFVAVAR